jgi:hypothetical protein
MASDVYGGKGFNRSFSLHFPLTPASSAEQASHLIDRRDPGEITGPGSLMLARSIFGEVIRYRDVFQDIMGP